MLGVIYAILFYIATAIIVVGVAMRIRSYARTPAPLKIPTTPAPTTGWGVFWRMVREVLFFQSLYKSNKWIWLFGWMMHMSLWLILARHMRYFIFEVWWWVEAVQFAGTYASFTFLIGLGGLLFRRFAVERTRYITSPSDILMLLLLIGIGASGTMMRFVAHTDIVSVKAFVLGLSRFHFGHLPADPVLLAHLTMVITLMIIFPISKLMHAPGVFFSPTRNQVDNSRDKRHLAPWAAELEK